MGVFTFPAQAAVRDAAEKVERDSKPVVSVRQQAPDVRSKGTETKDTSKPAANGHNHPAPSSLESKAMRAYERARQRNKAPQDRLKQQAHQVKQAYSRASVKQGHGYSNSILVQEAVDGVEIQRLETANEVIESPSADAIVKGHEHIGGAYEVDLEDLVKSAKVRKTKAGDFELIPPVGAVLVLDYGAFEAAQEDDWEHIYSEESSESDDSSDHIRGPSYAQVVVSAPHI